MKIIPEGPDIFTFTITENRVAMAKHTKIYVLPSNEVEGQKMWIEDYIMLIGGKDERDQNLITNGINFLLAKIFATTTIEDSFTVLSLDILDSGVMRR